MKYKYYPNTTNKQIDCLVQTTNKQIGSTEQIPNKQIDIVV